MKKFKFLGFLTCLYITFQLISDVTAGKIIDFVGFPVSVTVLYFPITFIFSDILTEVYGYSKARSVLWIVMICSITAGLVYSLVVVLPPASGFGDNEAYRIVLGRVPRILIGGWIAIFAGDIANNYVLAKMKIWTKGEMLWTRTIGSTIVGQFVNTVIFYLVGLYGIIPNDILFEAIIAGWIIKVVVEAAFTPLTYFLVNRLKIIEKVDHFDKDTRFNPFILESPF